MSNVSFYQVMNGELIKFSCQLIEKCYLYNLKTFVQVSNESICETLNNALWTFSQKAFIPHGSVSDNLPELPPIFISYNEECPIHAPECLFLLGVERMDIKNFDKILVVVDGSKEELIQNANHYYNSLQNLGHQTDYYIQNKKNGWDKLG